MVRVRPEWRREPNTTTTLSRMGRDAIRLARRPVDHDEGGVSAAPECGGVSREAIPRTLGNCRPTQALRDPCHAASDFYSSRVPT
jgi:hypothetical protein